jgi:polyphosphate kinase 2 (PPK2 family)
MLETVDLAKTLSRKDYERRLLKQQVKLREFSYELYGHRRSLVVVYEGWDAAGKGGSIRRLTDPLDPRGFEVNSIAAPTGEDRDHHYLWRFWRRLRPPSERQIMIFDRSWYGRVLVERVEGFCTEAEWKRAYQEINEFERQLADRGTILVKLWFHISPEEQFRRFTERETNPFKRWKLTEEDWRNRDKWADYLEAADEMLIKTSTLAAPWTVIEGDDKYFARVKALRTVVNAVAGALSKDADGDEEEDRTPA